MRISSKSLALGLFFAVGALAQNSIPPGTIIPAQFNHSLNSQKSKTGQTITARIMQDVPLSAGKKIRAGAKVIGYVASVSAPDREGRSRIRLRFDRIQLGHKPVPIRASLRALASMMEVEEAQIPPSGPDRGTPWAWTTRNLIGGEVAYGEGGPVARGTRIVGMALANGVLAPVKSTPSGCRGEIADNTQPQALWVFSSDACGVYGMPGVEITHAGRTEPLGEIVLTSKRGKLEISSGSGMLLRVNGENTP